MTYIVGVLIMHMDDEVFILTPIYINPHLKLLEIFLGICSNDEKIRFGEYI